MYCNNNGARIGIITIDTMGCRALQWPGRGYEDGGGTGGVRINV